MRTLEIVLRVVALFAWGMACFHALSLGRSARCRKLGHLEVMHAGAMHEGLRQLPLGTAEEERRRAQAWLDVAAFHARNEMYYRERLERALAKGTAQP